MQGHTPAEGMAEEHDRALHLAQELTDGLCVLSRTPRRRRRRGRPETGEVERQGGERHLSDRCQDGVEVPVGPSPAVEGEDTWRVGAGHGAEEASRRQRCGA